MGPAQPPPEHAPAPAKMAGSAQGCAGLPGQSWAAAQSLCVPPELQESKQAEGTVCSCRRCPGKMPSTQSGPQA